MKFEGKKKGMNRRGKYSRKPIPKPLPTNRYCIECGENTKFEYDRGVFHSRCSKCGGWMARQPVDKK